MRPPKKKISIALDIDVISQLKSIAEQDNRTLPRYISLILKRHLENERANDQKE